MSRLGVVVAVLGLAGCDALFRLDELKSLPTDARANDGKGGVDALADARVDGGPLAPLCPTAYILANGTSRYKIVPDAVDWSTAAADCADDEAVGIQQHTHLVVMSDANEYVAITTQLGSTTAWVGYSRRVTAPAFTWVDHEMGSAVWTPGDPSASNGLDCVVINSGALANASCFEAHPYGCECDAHPNDPSTY